MQTSTRVSLSERPYLDTILAGGLTVAHWLILERWFDPWSGIDQAVRMVIYQTGAGVVAVVASLAAVGIATGGAGERRQALRRLYGPELRRNWRSLLLLSVVASISSVVAMVADGNDQSWAPYLFEFAVLWTLLRMLRMVWLIDSLLALEDADLMTPERGKQLPVSDDFVERMHHQAS